jgi:hypothetical protein
MAMNLEGVEPAQRWKAIMISTGLLSPVYFIFSKPFGLDA